MWIIVPILLVILPIIWGLLFWLAWMGVWLFLDFILIMMSVKIVKPNTILAVEFLGKYNRLLKSWFHFIIPFLERTKIQYLYKKNFSVQVEGVTSDNVTCYIWLNVISYVEYNGDDSENWNVYKSLYSIDNPLTMMKATIDEQLRAMVVQFSHKEIFSKREELWVEIEEKLREKLTTFGYRLDSIQVRDVSLDDTVMKAMNQVVESLKFKEAAYNEADAEKIKQVKSAEADKESKILIWEGMAGQRMKIAEWFKESVALIQAADAKLTGELILEFLLDSSRIETLGNIWKDKANLVYLNENLEWKWTEKMTKLIAGSKIMKK